MAIGGGASTVRQYLAAGLLDELFLHLVPVTLGAGEPLFDGLGDGIDPSWLADLLYGLGETRLAAMATLAEIEVRAGDAVGAAALLVDVQDALGGCEPDPVRFEVSGSEECRAARALEVHLTLR